MNEIKREIDVREFECPFCGNIQSELISDSLLSEEMGEAMGYGLDGWECNECGAENEIGLEDFEEDYKVFRQFTDRDDFDGLLDFCKKNDFDDFMLTNLVKLCNQQRKFAKALDILAVILVIDNKNPDIESIMRNAAIGIGNGREIK
jgi:transcription elongation factor Elf1